MKNKNNIFVILFTVLLFMLILSFSCQPPAIKSSNSTPSNLPIKTITWQDDGTGFIQYYTNDINNCSMGFFTTIGNVFNPMQSVEIQVKKISGSPNWGYGILFCVQDNNNFYRILIDCYGYFNIYKKVNGAYSMITDWTFSSSLNQGYNVINDIKVTSNGNGTFTLYFNGTSIGIDTDTTFAGGDCGYYACVGTSSYESFPNTPVDVRCKFVSGSVSSSKEITNFKFTSTINTGLNSDCVGTISGLNIYVLVPNSALLSSLIPTFVTTGLNVKIGSILQTSSTTSNNYTNPLVYTVTAADGSTQNYTVTVYVIKVFGSYGSNPGYFDEPRGIAIDSSNNLYITDLGIGIQKFSNDGTLIWASSKTGNWLFGYPFAIATDKSANIYVTDFAGDLLKKFSSNGEYITQWGSGGSSIDGEFVEPSYIAIDNTDNVYVLDYTNRVQKFNSSGTFLSKWLIGNAHTMIFDKNGNYFINLDNQINKYDSSGNLLTTFGCTGYGLALDSYGNIYIANGNSNLITKYSSSGIYICQWGSYGSSYGQFNLPCGIAVDSFDNVYVTDLFNSRIQVFPKSYIDSLTAASVSSSLSLSKINASLSTTNSNKWSNSEGIKDNMNVKVNKKN